MTIVNPPTMRSKDSERLRVAGVIRPVAILLIAAFSAGCATYEPYSSHPPSPRAAATSAATSTAEQPVASNTRYTTQVYVYPSQGQSATQLDRDRYECYRWAVEQTGFDPSQPALAPHQRVEVIPAPAPGANAVAGALTGAVLGAIVSHPRHAAGGAAVGAVVGGLIGGASDAARVQQAEAAQRRYDQRDAEQVARHERQSSDYRRALSACLEGRGYTVK